jgi:hypothetical protein
MVVLQFVLGFTAPHREVLLVFLVFPSHSFDSPPARDPVDKETKFIAPDIQFRLGSGEECSFGIDRNPLHTYNVTFRHVHENTVAVQKQEYMCLCVCARTCASRRAWMWVHDRKRVPGV